MGHWDSAGKAMGWVAGTVLLCAVPLLAGCSGTTHAAATVTTAVTTPRPASAPAAPRVPSPTAPSTIVTTVEKTLYDNSSLTVTLTTMAMTRDHEVTAHVSYQNVGSSALTLYCSGVTDPTIDTLTSANGTVIPASHTYCSDHAAATIDLPPGGALTSYAVFDGVHASSGPFTLTWQENGTLSGAVSGITFG
jgi:hypothetical protein